MEWELIQLGHHVRHAVALAATVFATLVLLSSIAAAFTVRNAGFSATAYAAGFATDASGHGPRATAWDGTVLWSVDAADGGLYRADAGAAGPGPLTSLVATRVGTVAGGVNGLAVGRDGRLYATLTAVQQVVELSKADASVVRTLTSVTPLPLTPSVPCPASIATDPLSGDLFVTSCVGLHRVSAPATAPAVSVYKRIADQNIPLTAITIGPDGTMFVISPFAIYAISSTATLTPTAQPLSSVASPVGLAVATDGASTVPSFVLVSTADGAVYKVPGLGISSATTTLVLDGAGAGDQLSVGPDRCVYGSFGAAIVRVADATGGCALARAGVVLPTITLANTTGQDAHVDGAFQTFQAQLFGVTVPDGTAVTFTVTGANPGTFIGTTASGIATMSYRGHIVGADTIVASATVDGFPASASLSLTWLPQLDLAPPTVAFTYTVPAGGTGVDFRCANVTSAQQSQVACGWFTKAPTIHWIVTPNGSSGLGPLTNCDDYTLNYQPTDQGHHQICTATNGDRQASANLTVIINAILTPPTISAELRSNGAPYVPGTVARAPLVVHYVCASAVFNGIVTCPADETFGATGTYGHTATTVDVAGQRASVTWGPVTVDATPPSIFATYARQNDGATYVPGSWTAQNVVITFTCTDNDLVAACPAPLTLASSSAGVTVTARDRAGNVTAFTTQAVNIDTTPPTIVATAWTASGAPYAFGTPTNADVTVRFSCAADGAPVASCPADQVVSASGSVSGTAVDAAGNTASAVAGPIMIDRTAPTIGVTLTVGGAAYTGGWTRGPVLVHFSCADDRPGVVCPDDLRLSADQDAAVSGAARDAAGNVTTVTTIPIRIDTIAPQSTAAVTGTSDGSGGWLFSATVSLAATDGASGVASITYRIDGGAPVIVPGAAASLTLATEGTHLVLFHATDSAGNVEADGSLTVRVIFRQHTALAIVSSPFVATGAPVSARLLTDTGTPVAGQIVRFTAAAVTRTAVTDAGGIASADLGLPSGTYALTATFDRTSRYYASSASAQGLTVYALTRFVVWGPNAVLGARVQIYGADWAKQIADRGTRRIVGPFKGYADTASGGVWTGRPGDRVKAPDTIARYVGVIVTTGATRSGDALTGDISRIVVVRVEGNGDKPYDGRVGDKVFATVVGAP